MVAFQSTYETGMPQVLKACGNSLKFERGVWQMTENQLPLFYIMGHPL
jgi:hypothetical protein